MAADPHRRRKVHAGLDQVASGVERCGRASGLMGSRAFALTSSGVPRIAATGLLRCAALT